MAWGSVTSSVPGAHDRGDKYAGDMYLDGQGNYVWFNGASEIGIFL